MKKKLVLWAAIIGTAAFIIGCSNPAGSSGVEELQTGPSTDITGPSGSPTLSALVAADQQLTLQWTEVAGALSYEVWYAAKNDINAAKLGQETTLTSAVLTHLINNKTYYVWVKGRNAGGAGPESGALTGTPMEPSVKPPVPTGISVSASSSGTLDAKWSPMPGATYYNVYYGESNNPEVALELAGGPFVLPEVKLTSLINGAGYYIWVEAGNKLGASNYSASSQASPMEALRKPDLAYTGTPGKVTLSWLGVEGAASYEIWQGATNSVTAATTVKKAEGIQGTIQEIEELTNGTAYWFWVRAKNDYGFSEYSPAASGTPIAAVTGAVTVTTSAPISLDLSWDAVAGAADYEIWRHTGNDRDSAVQVTTGISGSTAGRSVTVSVPEPAVAYYFWVRPVNAIGKGTFYSDGGSGTSLARAASLAIVTGTKGPTGFTLQWGAVAGAAVKYDIYQGTSSNPASATRIHHDLTGTSQPITELTGGSSYYFWVRAKNDSGDSGYSQALNLVSGDTVQSIAIETYPTRRAYEGKPDDLDLTGLTITATYVGGSTAEVALGNITTVSTSYVKGSAPFNKNTITLTLKHEESPTINPTFDVYLADFTAVDTYYRDMAPITGALVSTTAGTTPRPFSNATGVPVQVPNYAIGKYDVDEALFKKVNDWAKSTDYNFARGDAVYTLPDYTASTSYPVKGITWRDAVVWLNAYSEMVGRKPVYTNGIGGAVLRNSSSAAEMNNAVRDEQANGYRLPTMAEWEYAARGGYPSVTWTYAWVGTDNSDDAITYANYKKFTNSYLAPVTGGYTPNSLGLYQMTGNIYKFMWDVLPGVPSGSMVVRGGNYTQTPVSYVAIDHYDYAGTVGFANATIRVTANSVGE